MFSAIFGFRGRLNRLQYFGGNCGLGASVVVVALVLVLSVGSLENLQAHPESAAGPLILFLLAIPIWLWISLSLQARRIRDIGLEPLIVIPSLIVLSLLMQGLGAAVPSLRAAGSLFSVAYDAALLFWPGTTGGGGAAAIEATPAIRPTPRPIEPAGHGVMRPAPMRPAVAGTPRFGRRGL